MIGNQEEQEYFIGSNPARLSAVDGLMRLAERVFLRTLTTDKPAFRVGFFLGRICVEDFNEILVLAANGYGVGALKILRGMYERAVTSAYLFENPEEADRFLDYHKVHKYRAYNHARHLREFAPRLAPGEIQKVKDDYEAVKAFYSEEICKPCNKTRVMGSWTKLDTASMALKAGKGYADLYYNAFYRPTLEVHTTVSSIQSRLTTTTDGLMSFKPEAQRVESSCSLDGSSSPNRGLDRAKQTVLFGFRR